MSEDKIIKNSKFDKIINSFDENDLEIDQDLDNDQDTYDDIKEYEDSLKSVDNIHKQMLKFVDDKALILCEYMTFDKLKSFIENEFL